MCAHVTKPQLRPKHQRFVSEYVIDHNGKQAAIRAGYKPSAAERTACVLLADDKVSQAVAVAEAALLARNALTADRVLEELRRLAFADARGFWDDDGNLKPMKDLSPEQGSVLAGFEAVIKNAKAGDGQTDTVHKIKLWDKTRALETLAKHFGLTREIHEHHFNLEDLIAGSMADKP